MAKRRADRGRSVPAQAWAPHLPPPHVARAVDVPGVAWMLRRRLLSAASRFAVGTAVFVPTLLMALLNPDMPGEQAAPVVVMMLVGAGLCINAIARAVGTIRLRRRLRLPWRSFEFAFAPGTWLERPWVELDLRGTDGRTYRISILGGEQAMALGGLPYQEIWFVGDPLRRGMLTPPGGPDLFETRGIWAGKPWLTANAESSYIVQPRHEPMAARRARPRRHLFR